MLKEYKRRKQALLGDIINLEDRIKEKRTNLIALEVLIKHYTKRKTAKEPHTCRTCGERCDYC